MTVKFIHTGDLHLGLQFENASFSLEYANKRRREIWETFDRIVQRAKEKEVDLLLIAGDLFEDEYCSVGDIKRIRGTLKALKKTRVIITTGNHDCINQNSLYNLIDWPDNVYIFQNDELTRIEFENINTVVWGLSWTKKQEKRNLVDDIEIENDKINFLVVHGDVFNNNSGYLPINKDKIKGFEYVCLGHIHKPQFISKNIAYCGSPEPLDFGETGIHGIIEGTATKSGISVEFIPFSKREFVIKNVELDGSMDFQSIVRSIITCDSEINRRNNLYRVILTGMIDRDVKLDIVELEEVLRDEFNYLELKNNAKLDYDLEKIEMQNKDNIIGSFIREMKNEGLENPIIKDALYEGLEVLFSEKVKR